MADPAQIIADPVFLAASPEMKRAILTKHDPVFAAASADMQARIVDRFGPGRREGLISGADRAPALSQTDPKAASISNPPGAMDYVKAGVRQVAETALPTAGLIGGGILGTAATGGNPAGGVGGAALGYAGGESANRVIRGLLDTRTDARPRLSHVTDEAKRVGSDLLTGATLDMLPPALLGVLRGGGSFLKGAMGLGEPTAETMAVRAAAQRQGIDLPAGAASDSRAVSQIEALPSRFPIGVQASQPTFARVNQQAQTAAERVARQAGPTELEQAGLAVKREVGDIANAQTAAPTDLAERFSRSLGRTPSARIGAGQQLKEGMQGSQRAVRAQADELYQAARAEAPADATVALTRGREEAVRIGSLESRLGALGNRSQGAASTVKKLTRPEDVLPRDLPDAAMSDLTRMGGDVADAAMTGSPIPFSSLPQEFVRRYGLDQAKEVPLDLGIELAKRARAMMRATTNDVEKAQFRAIATAISEDVGSLTPGLQRAGQFYRDEVARDFAPKSFVRKLIDLEPGRIAETVLTAQPDKVAAIMRQTPVSQRPMVQRMVFDKLRERSIDPRTGEVDPAKFESALQGYGEDNLRVVFSNRLTDLNAMRQAIRQNFGQGFTRPAATQGPGFGNVGNPFEVPVGAKPENVVNLMTGKGRSLEDLDVVLQSLSPQTRSGVGSSALNNVLYGPSRSSVGDVAGSFDPKTGMFSSDRFMTNLAKVSDETWRRILPPDAYAGLQDLRLVYQRLNTHARAAANPSQTAMAHGGIGQAVGAAGIATNAMLGNEDMESIAKKTLILVSPYLIGKGVFSRTGQRMLTSQPGTPPAAPNSQLSTLGKVLGIQLVPSRERK